MMQQLIVKYAQFADRPIFEQCSYVNEQFILFLF